MQSPPVMNAIELLETQHREVEDLFERLARTKGDARKKANLLDAIAAALALHTELEERHLYPVAPPERVVVQSVRQHLAIASELTNLARVHRSHRHFESRLNVLRQRVGLHITLEETLLFPGVERKLGEPALEVLGAEMLATMSERELGSRDGTEDVAIR